MNTNLLRKYAALVVRVGVNLQEDQPLVIHAPITCADFVHARLSPSRRKIRISSPMSTRSV